MNHKHAWVEAYADAIGVWEKRDCPGSEVYFKGRVERCKSWVCTSLRFICDDPRLQIVEVEK